MGGSHNVAAAGCASILAYSPCCVHVYIVITSYTCWRPTQAKKGSDQIWHVHWYVQDIHAAGNMWLLDQAVMDWTLSQFKCGDVDCVKDPDTEQKLTDHIGTCRIYLHEGICGGGPGCDGMGSHSTSDVRTMVVSRILTPSRH
jgi:hypothetical protein